MRPVSSMRKSMRATSRQPSAMNAPRAAVLQPLELRRVELRRHLVADAVVRLELVLEPVDRASCRTCR